MYSYKNHYPFILLSYKILSRCIPLSSFQRYLLQVLDYVYIYVCVYKYETSRYLVFEFCIRTLTKVEFLMTKLNKDDFCYAVYGGFGLNFHEETFFVRILSETKGRGFFNVYRCHTPIYKLLFSTYYL